MLFKLAWRNIWRNKRRTLITASSIFFAVVFSVFMVSLQNGGWGRMIDNVINFYVGYGQIHLEGYHDEPNINSLMEYSDELKTLAEEVDHLENLVPRLEHFALASYGTQTKGIMLCGIDPKLEDDMTHLKDRLVDGEYLDANDKAVLIADGIAELLNIGVGDTLVMISQGYHGVNAAGMYPIKGLVHFAPPDLNKTLVYLPLAETQYFFGADEENLISTLVLNIDDKKNLPKIKKSLNQKIDFDKNELIQWEQLVPGLIDAMNAKLNGTYMIMLILYAIITFGIFGTILMMAKEREYEFGILIAIGMKRKLLAWVVWLETVLLGFVGSVLGILGGMPLVYYFKVNPIDMTEMVEDAIEMYDEMGVEPIFPTSFELSVFFYQALIVFFISTLLAFYAVRKVRKLKPVEAMKNA